MYESTGGGSENLELYDNSSAYNKWLVLKFRAGGVAAFSDLGLSYRVYNLNLFQFSSSNRLYLAMNRVVAPVDGYSNKFGRGLCSVCIEWNEDGNLDHPDHIRTPTQPDDTATDNSPAAPDGNDTAPKPTAAAKAGDRLSLNMLVPAVFLTVSIIVPLVF